MQSLYAKGDSVHITSLVHEQPPNSLSQPGSTPNPTDSTREQGQSMSSLTSVVHNDAAVKDAVSVIGGLYAVQNPHLLALSRIEKRHLFEQLRALRENIAEELTNPTRDRAFFATLTSAVLLSFAEDNGVDGHASAATQADLDTWECRGLALTCIGSHFQRHVISRLNWYTAQTIDTFVSVMLAFYHCISVDISRMFAAWLRLGCEIPVMPHRLSYGQATNALQYAEQSISSLHLDAIFFGPILYALGMEMVRKADRRRMVEFIGKVRRPRGGIIGYCIPALGRVL
ncbi:hypothetical protein BJX63DRAFT_434110 [Aspergillus granulosus]|uniref:Uncharacterized protein n=1 Tax=Aspergillus granulosus TaxID=176169 RepID=A0ABR4H577_9EURO